MNKLLSLLAVAAAGVFYVGQAEAQAAKHRAVIEMTSDDPQVWEGVLNNVENLQKALGVVTIQVVAHGKGLAMLTTQKNGPVRDRMKKSADAGVVFSACENSMKKQNVKKEDLLPFAKTVDSGVAEVVRAQEAGWSYVTS